MSDLERAYESLVADMKVAYALRSQVTKDFYLEVKTNSTDLQIDPDSDPVTNLLDVMLKTTSTELSVSSLRELDKVRKLSSTYFNTMIQMIDLSK